MKKMMIALVAMFVMTMSANAQSVKQSLEASPTIVNNDSKLSFDRLSRYLELRVNQVELVKTAMAQFSSSMEAYYQLQDASKGGETWEKIQASHKKTMKKVLSEKQYNKYVQVLDLTVKNTADRIMEGAIAAK